jgi:hypothetical protein
MLLITIKYIKPMTEKLQQTIKEEVAQLPKEIQEAINAFDWVKICSDIGKENQLEEEEIEDFQLETLLVLVGATDVEFYAVNIENNVDTTRDKAASLASAAINKIFIPINNTIEESIKKNLKSKSPDLVQNLSFILSGGNYYAFLATASEEPEVPVSDMPSLARTAPPTLADIQANVKKASPPSVLNTQDKRLN